MAANPADETIYLNEAFERTYQYLDNTVDPPVPINVTNYKARLQMCDANGTPYVDASTDNGMITVDGVNGKFNVVVPVSKLGSITFTQGVYDMIIMGPDKDPINLTPGAGLTIRKGATRIPPAWGAN